VSSSEIVRAPGHVFYERLNAVLEAEKFDQRIETILPEVLQEQFGPSVDHSGSLLPDAVAGLLRRHRFGARHGVAGGWIVSASASS